MAFKIESSLLDACALAILSRGDTYGYEITQSMKQAISISESTLYPVLRRLQKEKLCRTYDEPYQGRNRRYYSITEEGRMKLHEYQLEWDDYRTAIDGFLAIRTDCEQLAAPEAEQGCDQAAKTPDTVETMGAEQEVKLDE